MVGSHDVQGEIDPGRGPGRGHDHVVVGDEQNVRVHFDLGKTRRQFGRVHPVRRGPPPVQQARGTQHERTRADRHDSPAVARGSPKGVDEVVGNLVIDGPGGNDDGVRVVDGLHSAADVDGEASDPPLAPRSGREDLELVPPIGVEVRPVQAEHLGHDRQFEQ